MSSGAPRLRNVLAVVLGIGIVSSGVFFYFQKEFIPVAEASQACPFSDGDGGTPGIQVTTNPAPIAAVPTPGDYYDCTASDVTIKSGVTVTLNTDTTTGTFAEIHFSNLTIESTAAMRSDAKGCVDDVSDSNGWGPNTSTNICAYDTAGAGLGGGGQSRGGSYGGVGGNTRDNIGAAAPTYGSPTTPTLFGSSGGSWGTVIAGGTGGGVVRLDISGTFTNDGTVSANGGAGTQSGGFTTGGGSGGSIYITTSTINGSTGVFQAIGGNAGVSTVGSGGGGGGRISVVYDTINFSANATSTFDASDFNTSGGSTLGNGTDGTKGSAYTVDNNGTTGTTTDDAVTVFHGFSFTSAAYDVSSWVEDASATVQNCNPDATTPSITAADVTLAGVINCQPTSLTNFSITASTTVTMNNLTFTIPNQKFFVLSGGAATSLTGTTTINANVQWTGLASLSVGSTSVINASSYGCTDSASDSDGYGPNGSNVCTYATAGAGKGGTAGQSRGGSYGGVGGNTRDNNYTATPGYGSPTIPVLFGSSGGSYVSGGIGGGTGGGVIRLDVTGTLTHNGILRANGGNGTVSGGFSTGGGSGGSIYITTATMNGSSGTLESIGGDSGSSTVASGGGGGGRIAIVYNTGSFVFVASAFNVSGGLRAGAQIGSATDGGKGSVYTNDNNATTGTATDDAVTIFHGFVYDDTDYSVASWTTDSSATNQYCYAETTTPSVTAPTVVLSGIIDCEPTSLTNFSISSSTTATMAGLTFTIPNQKFFLLSGGAATTLSGSTTINANVQWTGLGSLTTGSSSVINASSFGCTDSVGDANGYGPTDPGNVCTYDTAGAGVGGSGQSRGGSYGGVGGNTRDNSGPAAPTYGSASAPTLFGSSAGTDYSHAILGGAGGGVIRIDVTGTFTHNGTFLANGGSGSVNGGFTSGGGSGGSIYITTLGIAGSTGVLDAIGGGAGASTVGSGGGGGGRIALVYQGSDTTSGSFAINEGADTFGGLGASTYAAGGPTNGNGTSGTAGTLLITFSNPAPEVTAVTHSPSNPTQSDAVTLSGTATDGGGVTSIQIYLDSTAPANLKKTCTQAATSPVTCTVDVGVLSYGSHTTTIRASDGTYTTDGTETFTVGGPTQSGSTVLTRLAAGATATFTMSFAFQSGTHSGPLTVTFPSAFTLNSAAQGGSSSACLGSFAFDNTAKTLSATKTSCTGTITLGGASITNPGTPGSYTISWVNDDPGSTIVAIVDSDTVSMTASVDPFITANIGSQAAATACDGTFAGNGGTLALGSLSASTVTSSDASSVPHICIRVSTNAATGAVATVKSVNAALKSTSTPADTIDSATASPLATNTAGYGLCVGSAGGDTGRDSTTPTGALPTAASPFNGTCTSAAHNIGALTTGAQNVFTLSSPTQNAFARIYLKAGISTTTKSHTDYGDTLTFIVTGTF